MKATSSHSNMIKFSIIKFPYIDLLPGQLMIRTSKNNRTSAFYATTRYKYSISNICYKNGKVFREKRLCSLREIRK